MKIIIHRGLVMVINFKNRLLGALFITNLCVLIPGFSSYIFLGSVGNQLSLFSQGIMYRLEIAGNLKRSADKRAITVRNAAILEDKNQLQAAFKEFETYQDKTKKYLDDLDSAAKIAQLPKEVTDKIDQIKIIEAKYSPIANEIVNDLKNDKKEDALRKIREICTPTLADLTKAIDEYEAITNQRVHSFIIDTEKTTEIQKDILLITALLSSIISISLGVLLRKNIQKILGEEPEVINELLTKIAQGDLKAIQDSHKRTSGSILDFLADMQNQMASVVSQVRRGAENIATSSSEIANGNQDLSGRTESQASSLEETAASMEQLSSQVNHNAENARLANQLVVNASNVAQRGGEVVANTVSTMQEINDSSKRIADIIGVIDGIAFQTNILALNAAVEAARAGEQGRGFAVVASEVRSLAGRSASAAKEIKDLIDANMTRVEHGSVLVNEAGMRMTEIVDSINNVSTLIAEISTASAEQATGVAQVDQAVTAMDETTQQNAALVEQMAAATVSLSTQARELVQTVEVFNIGANGVVARMRSQSGKVPILINRSC